MIQEILTAIDLSPAYQLIERGGPVVIILAFMSVAALTVALFKFAQFLYLGVGCSRCVRSGLLQWRAGHFDNAIDILARRSSSSATVLAHTMCRVRDGAPEGAVREDGERVAHGQLSKLRAHLRVLEATSQVAPLLGLFGTVLGMMSAFQTLQAAGADADPAALAGGIWIALITTAVGLAVAIPAGLSLYWFEGRIEREAEIMEAGLTELFTGHLVNQSPSRRPAPTNDSLGATYAPE